MGTEFSATIYLPEGVLLTKDRRVKADQLDHYLRAQVEGINREYDQLDNKIKKTEIDKWRWLGQKIDGILTSTTKIEQTDLDNHYIWPAIGQYFRNELSRGVNDKKRSGTKNDHYRKCWALATIPGTKWITSWVGWDAFTDRGDQLVYSNRLMPLLEERFADIYRKLKPDDYKEIAKLLVRYVPTKTKAPIDIESMPDSKIIEIADAIYQDFIKRGAKIL